MINYLSTWSTQVNLYIFSRCCWGWILPGPLSDPTCDRVSAADLRNAAVYVFDLTLSLLKGTSKAEETVLHLNPFLEHCWESVKKLQPAGCKKCVSSFTYFDHVCSSGFVRTPHQGFSQATDTVKKISTRQIFFLSSGTTDALSVFEVILGGSLDGEDGGTWRTSKQRLQRAAENISPDCQQLSQWT